MNTQGNNIATDYQRWERMMSESEFPQLMEQAVRAFQHTSHTPERGAAKVMELRQSTPDSEPRSQLQTALQELFRGHDIDADTLSKYSYYLSYYDKEWRKPNVCHGRPIDSFRYSESLVAAGLLEVKRVNIGKNGIRGTETLFRIKQHSTTTNNE